MLNLQHAKRVAIIGGGTAGSFAALTMRQIFDPNVEVVLIESPNIKIVGVGEGGLLNFVPALQNHGIDVEDFINSTGATLKLGFAYEGWRTGKADDIYYHPFASHRNQESIWHEQGSYPLMTGLTAAKTDLTATIPDMRLIRQQCGQATARATLNHHSGLLSSLHFDAYKVGNYLKNVALEKGILHKSATVEDIQLDAKNHVTAIQFKDEPAMPVDFVIDASGLSRVIIGKKRSAQWDSFKPYLLMDRALPFYMPHPHQHPYLVTRAIAMDAGWMWQIPLQERVGAGYVYSSQHISDDQAVEAIHSKIKADVLLKQPISFDAGCFKQVWQGNVMALGLSSGFIEPLEATSIGQMLEQLRSLRHILDTSKGVITDTVIDQFNQANLRYWHGIRDFVRMHYDSPRRDTPFWQDVAKSPLPNSYQALKSVWQQRSPCAQDIHYTQSIGWQNMFHLMNWIYVGVAMGVMPADVAQTEINQMPTEWQQKINDYLASVKH